MFCRLTQVVMLASVGFLFLLAPWNYAWSGTLGNLTGPVDTRFLLDHHLYDIVWGNGRFVAVGTVGVDEAEVLLSADGRRWERVSLGKPPRPLSFSEDSVGALSSIAWNGMSFAAVGERIVTSPDGKRWTVAATFSPCRFSRVVAHYRMFVAVGESRGAGCIATSMDGAVWMERTAGIIGNDAVLTDVVRTEDAFVAVGSVNQGRFGVSTVFLSSPDGVSWTRQLGPADFLVDAAWNGASLVAVGGLAQAGAVFSSPDTKAWVRRTLRTEKPLRAVVWSGSRFVAVGVAGATATSPNGVTWSEKASGASQDLLGVAWNGAMFVAVGEGVILASTDGRRWREAGGR